MAAGECHSQNWISEAQGYSQRSHPREKEAEIARMKRLLHAGTKGTGIGSRAEASSDVRELDRSCRLHARHLPRIDYGTCNHTEAQVSCS